MLALREAHAPGATRVSVGGTHVLTGGADGVVSLFSTKQWPKAAALWSFRCHEAAVTDIALADSLALALSCGRDGRILLHENIFDTTKIVSRLICKVTGEVRCLQMDLERRRLYIAGDSLRCLDMTQDKFQIRTIPLVVPFPLVALAISPCGRFIAMASASGELGVVSTTAAADAGAPAMAPIVFGAVLSATAKREDTATYRMSWCSSSSSSGGVGVGALLLLLVPTATEVRVYALEEAAAGGTTTTRMRAVGGLRDAHLMDLHGALAYPVSKTRMACLMASREGLYIGKVDIKSLAMSRHTSERYDRQHGGDSHPSTTAAAAGTGAAAAVTDVQVNAATGDVVVGLADGCVSLLRRVSLRASRPASSATSITDAQDAAAGEEEAGDDVAEAGFERPRRDAKPVSRGHHDHRHRRAGTTTARAEEDDDFIDDASEDSADDDAASESDDGTGSASSASSTDSGAAPEDFARVVVDLQRSGASVRANDVDRPSRWRGEDGQAALAHAEREAERQRGRSRFLDDEAEEASTDEEEEEGDEGEGGPAGRGRAAAAAGAAAAAYDPEDHYDDGDDGDSVTGHADEGDDAVPYGRGNGGGAVRRGLGEAVALGRPAAVQDYSFQVGATPAGEEGSCYLAYNSVGYIHCSREATTIHFHDISFPAVRVQIRDTIVMGALSPVGAAFVVVPADPTEAQGSVDEAPRLSVFYHAFTPLGAQSEWRVALLAGETVRCVAAGIRYVAVATSYYLRLFSLSGLELAVLSKCQRIVTMVGTSSRKLMSSFKADFDPLAIITLTGTGELQMEVIDVGARATALPPRTVPLTELPDGSTHQLQWLGWSEDGLLHVVDTAGVVRMFTEDWGGAWVPVYDPRTLVDQSFALWVYGISESSLMAYRYSRDDPSYPAAAASGLSTELVPLFLPLTRTMGEDGLERWDKLLRQQLRSDELKRHSTFYNATIAKYDEVHDHHLLQFFDAALKGQQTTRAMELAMLMELHDRIVKCAQLANSNGYVKLVPKLLALYEMRMSTKQKRRCGLPSKESLVSDRKKDEVLHKLLGQMLPQDKKGKSAVGDAGDAPEKEAPGKGSPTGLAGQRGTTAAPAAAGATSPTTTATTPAASAALSPSAASTATTADSQPQPQPTTARRHISFAKEAPAAAAAAAAPSSQRSLASTASSTATTASASSASTAAAPAGLAPVRKVANPFAKPAARAEGGSTGEAPRAAVAATPTQPTVSVHQHQARLPTVLGAAQPQTPQRTVFTTTSSATPAPTTAAAAQEQDAATSRSPPDATPPGSRVSAGHADSTSPAHESRTEAPAPNVRKLAAPGTAASPIAFVAQELPNTNRLGGGPVDPFLEEAPKMMGATAGGLGSRTAGAVNSGAPETPGISVHSLLDVGHTETEPVARSNSFGEALRKRYRDDEDDDTEEAPVASLPKLFV